MVNYLRYKFALSEQGAKDLIKASIACTLTNISLMFPIGIIYILLKEMIDPILNGGNPSFNLGKYIVLSIVVLILIFVFQYFQYNKTFFASYTESANKRISLAEQLRKLPLSFFGKKDLSDLTTTIMGDCAGLETAFSHYIPELIGAVLSVIIASIGLFVMDWKLSIALLWVIPVAFIIVVIGKAQQDKVNNINKQIKLDYNDNIQECIETIRELKANNKSNSYLKELDKKLKKSESIQIKAELNTAMFVVSAQMLLKIGIATVVLVGGMSLLKGETDLLTFIMFLIAASRIFDPLSSSLINLAAIFSTLLQIKRMQEIEGQKIQTGIDNATYNGYDMCFENVGFSYNDNEQVLNNVSFIAKQGEITALVGPSGGGKSTAAKLAARFWDIDKGTITLGGTDISQVDPEHLLKNYSIVFQDVVLFNNTVMENIRIGKRNATDEEVIKAAKAARCEEFISKMPQGYKTIIGENGCTLSGGERQRLSIARALLKDAPVVLLDEATASLDVENETKIQEAISELVKNKTVLVIAHRMRTVAGADKIVVLSDGHVAEMGSPKELLNNDGIYTNMVRLQKKSSEWKLIK
ncbi:MULTISPECIES: ABC transporter ATP-binding protein [Clostridium]|uniref:ABC transporter ATP-binding protein n=1 Tax=Clostridium aquiflavi TaxID=3073603 RepID=A0ABU1EFP2_9CLOT|nr:MULTISPECIES: ABC transporter ATP-binding protein [unclassified Clostridium]MDR5587098.1 ABC transporter ATP-binding protein [Clostridium sp. 5N-1]NFG61301.1 ABC transporter ATP-binding protein [Clostridium botulinum]NFQ09228.1 ABC transporter ATP-binding protein [Clostridium botulinum]